MTNAMRHAQASSLGVELAYRAESVTPRARQRHGFEQDTSADGEHWGLQTTRARGQVGTLRVGRRAGHADRRDRAGPAAGSPS
jgi:nitrate/nitrite-specific signal transduction histidine kinase